MNIIDILWPTIVFTVCSLLTVPLVRLIKRTKKDPQNFIVAWILLSFSIAAIGVYRIASEYFTQSQPVLQISAVDTILAPISTTFLVDTVSVYMVSAYIVVGTITCLYSVLHVNSKESLSERYYALLLIVTGTVIAATFSGDLLTLFIFWESTAAGACFIVAYKKTRESLESALKYLIMVIIASGFTIFGLSLLYSLTGSLNFWTVKEVLLTTSNPQLLLVAFAFIIAGYA
ncbi:MAG: proton-conducting transporter membrane subunit, partial [Candidatus Bathyarchaeota archaeon]